MFLWVEIYAGNNEGSTLLLMFQTSSCNSDKQINQLVVQRSRICGRMSLFISVKRLDINIPQARKGLPDISDRGWEVQVFHSEEGINENIKSNLLAGLSNGLNYNLEGPVFDFVQALFILKNDRSYIKCPRAMKK